MNGGVEFGGKPFGGHHTARVLPGYDPDCKAELLHELNIDAKIVMVVNAKDIMHEPAGRYAQGRIRGDTGLLYSEEALRLIEESAEKGFSVRDIVTSIMPREECAELRRIEAFRDMVTRNGLNVLFHYEIPGYPSVQNVSGESFAANDVAADEGKNLVVFSPGGGRGKFGVILSEIYHSLFRGEMPHFIKFETFPVYNLPARHPLNLAFEAATADLGNRVLGSGRRTCYDKDVENFRQLQETFTNFNQDNHPLLKLDEPAEMGINMIEKGITNIDVVISACEREIRRRLERYQRELGLGYEKQSTVQRVKEILKEFESLYLERLEESA